MGSLLILQRRRCYQATSLLLPLEPYAQLVLHWLAWIGLIGFPNGPRLLSNPPHSPLAAPVSTLMFVQSFFDIRPRQPQISPPLRAGAISRADLSHPGQIRHKRIKLLLLLLLLLPPPPVLVAYCLAKSSQRILAGGLRLNFYSFVKTSVDA